MSKKTEDGGLVIHESSFIHSSVRGHEHPSVHLRSQAFVRLPRIRFSKCYTPSTVSCAVSGAFPHSQWGISSPSTLSKIRHYPPLSVPSSLKDQTYYETHVARSIAVAGALINAGATTVVPKLSQVESNHLEFAGPPITS